MPAYSAQEYERLADTFERALKEHRAKIMEPEMVISALRIASMQDEIVAVLEPFANFIEGNAAKSLPDSFAVSAGSSMARQQLTAGDCRKARALLSKLTGSENNPTES